MNKFSLALFLSTFFLLSVLSVNLSAAFTIYVQPANQGIVRLNVTLFHTATEKRSFEIKNLNNFSTTVNLQPSENITKIIDIEKSFTLEPNESRRVEYTVKVSEPGDYNGQILITFSSPEGYVTYESKLRVIAKKAEFNYSQFLIPVIILAAIAFVLVFARKWKIVVEKKRLKK